MNHLSRVYIIVLFLLSVGSIKAQSTLPASSNITGSWETYRNEEFMQFNIEQRNTELCGYTYDYELYDRESYCKANFSGRYDIEKKIWYLSGTGFIENSGTHVLMRIILWRGRYDPVNVLHGKVFLQSSANTFFGMGGDDVVIKKVSGKPVKQLGQRPCFPVQPKPAITNITPVKPPPVTISKMVKPKPAPAKPVVVKPVTVKPAVRPENIEPPKKIVLAIQAPGPEKKDSSQLQLKMIARKRVEQSRLIINVKRLNLKLYDNGTVDGDSVSVFYNGRLLITHQRLSEKPIELNIELDETTNIHEITMYAENLGTIVPNTALVVVTAGDKRYELRSKASLEENAVLVFEYKPK